MNYEVQAIRSGRYWELHIKGEGVTQSRTLAGVPKMVREWLATEYERDYTDAVITIHPVLNSPVKTARAQKVSRPRNSPLVHS